VHIFGGVWSINLIFAIFALQGLTLGEGLANICGVCWVFVCFVWVPFLSMLAWGFLIFRVSTKSYLASSSIMGSMVD